MSGAHDVAGNGDNYRGILGSSYTRIRQKMTEQDKKQLGNTLWGIADQLRGAMNADDFRDYMFSFLFLRYLSDNYETAAQKELGPDYPKLDAGHRRTPFCKVCSNSLSCVRASSVILPHRYSGWIT